MHGYAPGTRLTSPLERRESVCQPRKLTRCRFRRHDQGASPTQNPESRRPPQRTARDPQPRNWMCRTSQARPSTISPSRIKRKNAQGGTCVRSLAVAASA
jgi:hypothetical protein